MTKRSALYLFLVGLSTFFALGCNTTKTIYRSSTSNKDYQAIKAVTLSHCGCTHIYASNDKNGELTFEILYTDNLARKTVFSQPPNSKTPQMYSLLATTSDNFTTPFDSLDIKIFNAIDSAIIEREGMVYPVRWTKYKGYVADTLLNRN
jgi:hypothetical protein